MILRGRLNNDISEETSKKSGLYDAFSCQGVFGEFSNEELNNAVVQIQKT